MSKPDDKETWGRSKVETVCSLDCPDTCSVEVTVEKGKIVAIDGSHKHTVTDGYICGKVRRFDERVYGNARLRHPLVREGTRGEGRFRRASWDDALSTIATRMIEIRDQWGAEAILPFSYGGSNGLLTQDTVDARLFRQFGTSRLARTVCPLLPGASAQIADIILNSRRQVDELFVPLQGKIARKIPLGPRRTRRLALPVILQETAHKRRAHP